MDPVVTLNIAGYAIVVAAGFALGSLFGRRLAAEFLAIAHALEARVAAVESALRASTDHAPERDRDAALFHHAVATEKLASAIEKQAAVAAATSATAAPAAPQGAH